MFSAFKGNESNKQLSYTFDPIKTCRPCQRKIIINGKFFLYLPIKETIDKADQDHELTLVNKLYGTILC